MKSDERIRAFLGISTLVLKNKDSGLEEKFMVKSIKINDFAEILSVMVSDDDDNDNVAPLMEAVSRVGLSILKRSFQDLTDEEVENLLITNYSAVNDCIMNQVMDMMRNEKADKIEKIQKKTKDTKVKIEEAQKVDDKS